MTRKSYKPPKHSRIKVTEAKLGREDAFGDVDLPPHKKTVKLRIEARLRADHKMDATIHEGIHLFDPTINEVRVRKMATYLSKLLWRQGYKKQK